MSISGTTLWPKDSSMLPAFSDDQARQNDDNKNGSEEKPQCQYYHKYHKGDSHSDWEQENRNQSTT